MIEIIVDKYTKQHLYQLHIGGYKPLKGLLDEENFWSVTENYRLTNNAPWAIPLAIPCTFEVYQALRANPLPISIRKEGRGEIGVIKNPIAYQIDLERYLNGFFKTTTLLHPGVAREKKYPAFRVGGEITFSPNFSISEQENFSPTNLHEKLLELGAKTACSFQTRNPSHRAHEHMQRMAMEICDVLVIQPILGEKKSGDFTNLAIKRSFQKLIDHFYPRGKVIYFPLVLPMSYSGPREALHNALVRKNYGCTHFIVGRDHAGVGNFYGKYDAQNLAKEFEAEIGINILNFKEPRYCRICQQFTSKSSCGHSGDDVLEISGSSIRDSIMNHKSISPHIMRKELVDLLLELESENSLFI